MNPTTLKQVFKSVYGSSLAAHMKEHRMGRAAQLLRETDESVAEIARAVGYGEPEQIYRGFQRNILACCRRNIAKPLSRTRRCDTIESNEGKRGFSMKVLNFGSWNIDYVYQMEHFIRPGETAPCTALSAGCGGKGLNQSIALAKAGTEVYHAGLYGAEGKFLLDKMQEAGVDTSLLRLGEGANGHAIIQVERSGQNCIILYGGTNRQITQDYADEVLSHFAGGRCSRFAE